MPCPLPRRIKWVHMSMASPFTRPSPNDRRVGIRIGTFEACSGFTRVTARRIAQPPKATFVARLQPGRLPDKAARQLPDLSTTIWVEPSSTGVSRLRGARPSTDLSRCSMLRSRRRCSVAKAVVGSVHDAATHKRRNVHKTDVERIRSHIARRLKTASAS